MAYIEREVERSVPELKAGNLLSHREIRQIIKERTYFADRKFKYSRHDFLRYIQFENKLFRLVLLRSQSRKDLNKNDIVSIRKRFIYRINQIYNIALNRYSSDKQLWLLSFDFAKRYSERISRAKFLKALLLHPHWIDAWIEAAKYEYEWNKNPTNARLLYQRAISLNKKSLSLYLSFFKMELTVIKQHLNWNFNETDAETRDEDDDSASFDWKKELKALKQSGGNKKKGNNKKDEWLQRIYSEMEVPKLILRYAMQNIEEKKAKYALIKRMLLLIPTRSDLMEDASIFTNEEAISKRFDELKAYVFEYLEKHYYFDCVIIQLLARKNVQIYSKKNQVLSRAVEISGCQVFERAMLLLSAVGEKYNEDRYRIDILNAYIKYIQNRVALYINLKQTIVTKRDSEEEALDQNDLYLLAIYENVTKYLMLRLVDSFEKLHDLSGTNAVILQEWILTLTQMDAFAMDDALRLVELGTKQYPQSVELWKLYADLYGRQLSVCGDEKYYKEAIAVCVKGIQRVATGDAPKLWINMIDIMMAQLTHLSLNGGDNNNNNKEAMNEDSDSDSDSDMEECDSITKQVETIHATFREGIEECLSHNDEIKESYLRWIVTYHSNDEIKILNCVQWFDQHTLKCSPKIYKNILDIYESILLFDCEQKRMMNHTHRVNIDRIARVYEKCLNQHGKTKPQVWLWYIQYAQNYMKVSVASSIYQRAMKTLSSDGLQLFLKQANIR